MLKPSRPYLVKALYDWLLDSDLTPHLLVDATNQNAILPMDFVQDGQIVLNVNPSAIRNFYMDDEAVSFNARFSGQPIDIYVPMQAIMAIYAREDGQGMAFGAEPGAQFYEMAQSELKSVTVSASDLDEKEKVESDAQTKEDQSKKTPKKKATLTVIK